MNGTRAMTACEAFLQDRVQRKWEGAGDQGLFELALHDLMQDLGTAVGQCVGDTGSTYCFALFTQAFLGKLSDIKAGVPQEIRIAPKPVPKAAQPALDLGHPEPDLEPPALLDNFDRMMEEAFDVYMSGNTIYWARKAKDLHQADLAELLGIKQPQVSQIERDRLWGNRAFYLQLRELLDMPVEVAA